MNGRNASPFKLYGFSLAISRSALRVLGRFMVKVLGVAGPFDDY
jgi:hypothetical protein